MNDFDINFVSCNLNNTELFTEDDLWILDYPTEPSATHHDSEKVVWMEHNGMKYFNDKKFFPVSVDNFLLIDDSFSNLLIAVSDKVVRFSFFVN